MQSRQSREVPTLLIHSDQVFFPPKSNIWIGCWNVRTLGDNRLRDVLCIIEEKNIELLALSEVRWPGHGTVQIKGRMVLYSGPSTESQKGGSSGVE